MTRLRASGAALLTLAVLALPACRHGRGERVSTAPPSQLRSEGAAAPTTGNPRDAFRRPTSPTRSDGTLPLGGEEVVSEGLDVTASTASGVASPTAASALTDVFFDTDEWTLDAEARDLLDASAAWLRAHPDVSIVVEGHCDERNTREYNLALGDRRATTVREYLLALGVEDYRVRPVSYGEERPFALGSDESAWRLNRRAHFAFATSTEL